MSNYKIRIMIEEFAFDQSVERHFLWLSLFTVKRLKMIDVATVVVLDIRRLLRCVEMTSVNLLEEIIYQDRHRFPSTE